MKNRFLISLLSVAILTGCSHNQNHDEGHDHSHHDSEEMHDAHANDHDHEAAHGEPEEHEHAAGVIHFSDEQAAAAGLRTETMQPAPFTQVLKVNGEILSAEGDEMTLVARSSGVVTYAQGAILTDGAAVRQGQTLFKISSQGMTSGDAVNNAQAEHAQSEELWQRAQRLYAQQLITKDEYDAAQLRYQLSVQVKGADVVTSPFSGYLLQCLVSSGSYVSEGQALAVVSRHQKLQLHADVSARYYDRLNGIVSADLQLPYSEKIFHLSDLHGRLLSIGKASGLSTSATDFHGSSSSMASPYIPVIFEFDYAPGLFAGSFADVFLLCGERQGVLSLPLSALTEEQGLFFVYLKIGEDDYRKQEVKVGQRGSERVEILSGLQLGDEVVTSGAYQIKLASVTTVAEGHHHH